VAHPVVHRIRPSVEYVDGCHHRVTKNLGRWIVIVASARCASEEASDAQQEDAWVGGQRLRGGVDDSRGGRADASGATVSATPTRDGSEAVTRQIQQELRGWVFRPAQQDGEPARTSTWLRVTAIPGEDGAAARILSAMVGPAPQTLSNPVFPKAAQLRGQGGVVVLALDMDAQGRVQDVVVYDSVGEVSRAMANAAITAARAWTFRPELVEGAPQAAKLLMPVCFVATEAGDACSWTGPEDQSFGRYTVLTLNSAARLENPLAYAGR
jgi:TonB family protein